MFALGHDGAVTRIASSDDVEVALHALGGSGPTLLVSHATGMHGRAYGPMALRLTADFTVWAADLRGHGEAGVPAGGDFVWRGFRDDVLAVVDHLRARDPDGPLVAFGHSMGGAALLLAELARPGTFARLYLFEPIVFPPTGIEPRPNPLAEGARRRRERFDSYEAAIERYASKPPMSAFRPDALEAYVRHGFEPDGDGVRIRCRGEHEARTFEHAAGHDAWDRLGELDLPVRLGVGDDGSPPAVAAPLVADRIEGATLEHFAFTHFGPFTHPDEVGDAVRRFLAA